MEHGAVSHIMFCFSLSYTTHWSGFSFKTFRFISYVRDVGNLYIKLKSNPILEWFYHDIISFFIAASSRFCSIFVIWWSEILWICSKWMKMNFLKLRHNQLCIRDDGTNSSANGFSLEFSTSWSIISIVDKSQ